MSNRSRFVIPANPGIGSRIKSGMTRQSGFTLIEAVVTMTVFALGIISVVGLTTIAKSTSEQGRDTVQANNYLQEGVEAVRGLRDTAWSNVSTAGAYRLQSGSNPPWTLASGGSETIGKYSRTVQIAAVQREDTDGNTVLSAGDKIVTSGGTFTDAQTRKVTVTITWQQGSRTVTRSLYTYLTDWKS